MQNNFLFIFSFLTLYACEPPLQSINLQEMSQEEIMLEDFSENDLLSWNIVDDTVMGGRSRGSFKINNNVGEFKGYLSLANNGGFSSVRAYYPYDLIGISSITLRIKGDGRKYNFRVRTNKNSWVSYSHSFSTEPNTWQEITLNIQDFFPTYRGYNVQNVQRLSELLIREIGIMISDKNEGNFALMIDWIMVN
tara:strand:+ start:2189 stop:2767 length:579 start_codon:yes stop_codon:yes gene_type:complete